MVGLAGCVNTSESGKQNDGSANYYLSGEQLLRDLKILASEEFTGRKTGTAGIEMARVHIVSFMEKHAISPWQSNYRHDFAFSSGFSEKMGENLIGFIPSINTDASYVVLTAHYDHVGQRGSRTFYGADDNASGTAALMHIAAQLVKRDNNYHYVVLFTDAEELGLKGAKAFVKQNPEMIESTVLNVNIDMIAGAKTTTSAFYLDKGVFSDKAHRQSFQKVAKSYQRKLKKGPPIVGSLQKNRQRAKYINGSDHGVFARKRIPFIYYGVGEHKNYHTPKDSFENVNQQLFVDLSNIIYEQILFLDDVVWNNKSELTAL